MGLEALPDLVLNLSLLVALTVISTFFWRRFHPQTLGGSIIQGILFGAVAVIGMIRPLKLQEGLIFDGCTIVISLCALFFGPRAAIASLIVPALYRAGLGGPGVYMGVLTLFTSGLLGLIFHARWRHDTQAPSLRKLLWFGLVVHVVMLVDMLALPAEVRGLTFKRLALPIILIYPLVTVLAGKILSDNFNLNRLVSQLQKTNQELDITLRSIADGVISTDLQGRIATMNPTAEQLTGWNQAEAQGRAIQEVFPIFNEQTGEVVENPVSRVLVEGRVVGLANHTVLKNRQGQEFPIADSAAPIKDDEDRCCGVVLVFRDQSRERQAHKALRESEARYRTLVESAPALVWRCTAEGAFDYFNQRWLAFRGRTLQQEQGSGWQAGVHPEDVSPCRERFQQAFDQRQPFQSTFRLQRHDGCYRWMQVEALPLFGIQHQFLGYMGFCLDINDLRESLERERHLISALEASAACIFLADTAGFIEWVNPAFATNLRMPREAATGQSWEDYFLPPPVGPGESLDSILTQLLAGQTWRGELQVRRADGAWFDADCTFSPLAGAQGKTVKVVGVFEDLTDRKALEEKLRQIQKLDVIGKLASDVAHDFNNLLTTIQLSANILQDTPSLPDDARLEVQEILGAAEKGASLTGQLLSFSRRAAVPWETFDLNEALKAHAEGLRKLLGSTITLVTHYAPERLWLRGDRNRLHQIIMNLALNARDAMPKGGTLLIETARVPTAPALTFAPTLPKEGPFVCVSVQDTGAGMSPEVLARIFEPFFTTKSEGRSTGLGLTIVSTILRDLHGGLHVESQPGQGATFRLYFPAAPQPDAPPAAAPEAPLHGGSETLLLLEDDTLVRDLTAKTLRRHGYQVLTAANGREALGLFDQHGQAIHLLITDILLPENLRGDEVAQQLLARNPSLKVIYISGFPGESPAAKPNAFKDKTFIPKPFTPRQLLAAVYQTLHADPSASRT